MNKTKKNADKLYFIWGFFFQLDVFVDTRNRDYLDTFVQGLEGLCKTMFHGFFWYDNDRNDMIGEMDDRIGHSRIYVALSENQLSFVKKYDESKEYEVFQFLFNRGDSDWWIGKYTTPSGAEGESKCMIKEISLDALNPSPETIQQTLLEFERFKQQGECGLIDKENIENSSEGDLPWE